jgi:hypothetical protein
VKLIPGVASRREEDEVAQGARLASKPWRTREHGPGSWSRDLRGARATDE